MTKPQPVVLKTKQHGHCTVIALIACQGRSTEIKITYNGPVVTVNIPVLVKTYPDDVAVITCTSRSNG